MLTADMLIMTSTALLEVRTPRYDSMLRSTYDFFRPGPRKPRLLLNERRLHLLAFEHKGHEHSLPTSMLVSGQSRQTISAVDKFFNG